MGFDLNGCKPKSEKGEYFRNNVWWWYPLWSYVAHNCDDILAPDQVKGGNYNDGVEIHAWQAQLIADRLYKLLGDGEPKEIENEVRARYEKLPEGQCKTCEGTGLLGKDLSTCLACKGTGKRREVSSDWYPFSEENVREFADFCSQSGGFTIW